MTKLPIIVQFIHCISTQTHITTTLRSSGGYSKRRPTCTDAYIHIHRYDYIHSTCIYIQTYIHTCIHIYTYNKNRIMPEERIFDKTKQINVSIESDTKD